VRDADTNGYRKRNKFPGCVRNVKAHIGIDRKQIKINHELFFVNRIERNVEIWFYAPQNREKKNRHKKLLRQTKAKQKRAEKTEKKREKCEKKYF
jgi:hypothetical protein